MKGELKFMNPYSFKEAEFKRVFMLWAQRRMYLSFIEKFGIPYIKEKTLSDKDLFKGEYLGVPKEGTDENKKTG